MKYDIQISYLNIKPIITSYSRMATFNDILKANLKIDNENANEKNRSELIINVHNRETLFQFDETKPIAGNVAYDLIYYLDNNKIYTPTKTLGTYTLKNHQLTSLYYMRGLEQMLYDVRRTVKNPEKEGEGEAKTKELNSTHYTNVGILSDKVGAGKSYCIMALINEAKSLTFKQLPFRNVNYGSNDIKLKDFNKLDTNILMVPHSLVGQWKKYLENSGLKFMTIQKARDIFELADSTCTFKGKAFSMIAKEDDEKVIDDEDIDGDWDEDEDISQNDDGSLSRTARCNAPTDNSDAQSITSNTSSKPNDKTNETNKTNKGVKATKEPSTKATVDGTLSTPKKKVSITKRSKAEVQAVEAEQAQAQKVDEAIPDQPQEKIKKDYEKEKKQLALERRKINNNLYENRQQQWQFANGTPERQAIATKCSTLAMQLDALDKQIDNINTKIKEYDLAKGDIKVSEIIKLHSAFETANREENPTYNLADNLKAFINNFGFLNKEKAEKLDVILVSATFYNLFALYINREHYTINRLIIDECNSVKGNRLVEIKRIFTWLITSSIQSMMTSSGYIQKPYTDPTYGYIRYTRERTVNSTGLILNMIKEIYENKEENYKLYLVNRPEYIEQSMSLPEMKTLLIISKDNLNIQVLGGIVSHDVLQMLNAGDIDGIITKLDVAVGDETNIIKMITRKYQDELKVKEYELKVAIENPKYNHNNETIGVINKRTAIVELKKKIACIEERIKTVESCPICYDDFNNPAITPCCSNKFCFDCITMVLNSKPQCPLCKAELNIKNMMFISNKSKEEIKKANEENIKAKIKRKEQEDKNKVKTYDSKLELLREYAINYSKYENMDRIFELNHNNPKKKYLIFTEYESTLNDKITYMLDKWGLKYGRIKGSGIIISNLVEQYKTGDINTLLINSKYFGSGMNLENTTDIIIIHKMQADVEMQVIGRAQRFGRVGNLRVWKLYYQNEVENT